MKITVTNLTVPGVTLGEDYDVIEAPKGENSDGGKWITNDEGAHVKIEDGNYDLVEETAPEKNVESEKKGEPITQILGYDMKAKQKDVPILNPVIKKTAKGSFMVSGMSAAGNKMTTLVSKDKALAAIEAGIATKEGW